MSASQRLCDEPFPVAWNDSVDCVCGIRAGLHPIEIRCSGSIPRNLWCALESSEAFSGNANTGSTVGYNPLDRLIRNLRLGLALVGAGDG
jgi:hypothetical protein